MNRSHVIRLNPTPEQEVYFRKACGVAHHVSLPDLATHSSR